MVGKVLRRQLREEDDRTQAPAHPAT
jgi:hypothetical protein